MHIRTNIHTFLHEYIFLITATFAIEEEMKIVKNIMKSLSKDLHKQNLAAKGSKHGHHHSGNKSHKVSEQ